jgi:hypothetical protein
MSMNIRSRGLGNLFERWEGEYQWNGDWNGQWSNEWNGQWNNQVIASATWRVCQ